MRMKRYRDSKCFWTLLFAAVLLMGTPAQGNSSEPLAEITSIRLDKTNVLVEVRASSSLLRVTLESSTRVGRRSWQPRAVRHLEPSSELFRTFTFTLPQSAAIEILRVRAEMSEILPASAYLGTNTFVSSGGN